MSESMGVGIEDGLAEGWVRLDELVLGLCDNDPQAEGSEYPAAGRAEMRKSTQI